MNRLSSESSPYLLQHADNPVDWFPWGKEAFHRRIETLPRAASTLLTAAGRYRG